MTSPPKTAPPQDLAASIRGWAKELGFQELGISDIDLGEHEDYLQKWLDAGYHGSMATWQATAANARGRPS